MENKGKIIGIVGLGPRGLYALECLVEEMARCHILDQSRIFLFEPHAFPGSGPNYDPRQEQTNLINIPLRNIELPGRNAIDAGIAISGFPSFNEWTEEKDNTDDVFLPRSEIGRYLHERFRSVYDVLASSGVASLVKDEVVRVVPHGGKVRIQCDETIYTSDHVLLTIGHQPIYISEELLSWKNHANSRDGIQLIEHPYPVRDILASIREKAYTRLGLRGFGLSMIDVARGIALAYGHFDKAGQEPWLNFHGGEEHMPLLVPFSTDGLPMAPKPINEEIDQRFKPGEKEVQGMIEIISNQIIQAEAGSVDFLLDQLSPVIAAVFVSLRTSHDKNFEYALDDVADTVKRWFSNDEIEHPLVLDKNLPARMQMQKFVLMATGKEPPSLDYTIGQVWRHIQFDLHEAFSFGSLDTRVLESLLELNERMKRYSYGPPVDSILQLIALHEAGCIATDFLDGPDINLSEQGWVLNASGKQICVPMMVNCVLDGPEVSHVKSPVVRNLVDAGLIEPWNEQLGAKITPSAMLVAKEKHNPYLSLIGRLAIGSLFVVDSLSQSFGEIQERWAREVVAGA